MGYKFISKGDAWHIHCFFALTIFTETEAQDNIVNKGKTNYIQESSKKTYFIVYDFFFIFHMSPDITLWYRKLQHTF
jgi:hypothetical protein